tara:strand:+ start:2949 stop:3698 length:750 start_codon:yes stop_codon:yes gene_type:complete
MNTTTSEFEEIVETTHTEEEYDVVDNDSKTPSEYDPEWSEYLLDQLSDSELINGAPTVDGLRRITEKCFGEIIGSNSTIIESPTSQNNQRCTICHTLTISKYRSAQSISVDGCVDVLYHKTPYPFKDHLVATADTRAEGKALRRALKIRVVTAEELQNEDEQEALSSDELVNDQQVLALNQLCKRLDLSVTSFVKGEHNKVKKINELRNLEARLLIAKLSEFQRTPKDVPESYMGYDENWKSDFYGSSK